MEVPHLHAEAIGGEISPVFESPLGLFHPERWPDARRQIRHRAPAADRADESLGYKRLEEIGGDISQFSVVKLMPVAPAPDRHRQDRTRRREQPGRLGARRQGRYPQARKLQPERSRRLFLFSGGLNRATQGVLEFVEMFKAPIKVLHPLLTATQEGNYNGTENFGAFPYRASSSPTPTSPSGRVQEQQEQRGLPRPHLRGQGALLPARHRRAEDLREAAAGKRTGQERPARPTCWKPGRFSVSTRLRKHENSPLYTKMRVYDGENLKESDPKAKSVQEYRDAAGVDEGMTGISDALRLQGPVADLQLRHQGDRRRSGAPDVCPGAGDPREQFPRRVEALSRIHQVGAGRALCRVHRPRDPEGLSGILFEYGQNLFDRYIAYADAWIEDQDFKDPDTGQILNREFSTGTVADRKAGRHRQSEGLPQRGREVHAAGSRQEHGRKNPSWTSYEKLAKSSRSACSARSRICCR
jgi:serine protein kinase